MVAYKGTKGKEVINQYESSLFIHFRPVFHCYTPWNRQKTSGFLMFPGGIEMELWDEMG